MAVRKRRGERGATWPVVCRLAMKLPGVEMGVSYGTPALRVRKKYLGRLKEDGETVALRIDFSDRDLFLALDPSAFYLTDHYKPYPAMLIRLKEVRLDLLRQALEKSWRQQAPRSLLAESETPGAERGSDAPAESAATSGKNPRRRAKRS